MRSNWLVLAYLAAIVAANLLVATFGPGVTIINAFLFIGLDITTRDALHDQWHGRYLWPKMAALIVAGSALSWLLNQNAGPIALASLAAFAASGVVDALVYALLGKQARLVRVNGSNILSAAVDSLVFPTLAFGALLWPIVLGQFAAKVLGGFLWSLVLTRKAQTVSAVTNMAISEYLARPLSTEYQDAIHVDTAIRFSWHDRLRILFGHTVMVSTRTLTKNLPGKTETDSVLVQVYNNHNRKGTRLLSMGVTDATH